MLAASVTAVRALPMLLYQLSASFGRERFGLERVVVAVALVLACCCFPGPLPFPPISFIGRDSKYEHFVS